MALFFELGGVFVKRDILKRSGVPFHFFSFFISD